MGKLAPARVSYRDDFVISYHFYMMTRSFHHPTSNVLKLTKPSWIDKNQLRMRYPFQSTCKPISHRNEWSFRVYTIQLRIRNHEISYWSEILAPVREPGWTRSHRGDSRWHDILWWYHANKCRAMRGNRSELAPARRSPRCHVNTP